MITIPDDQTPISYARALAEDMAKDGLESLMDVEVSLRELQEMPLAPEDAVEAARLRGLMLALQAGLAAFPARLEGSEG